LPDSGLNNIPQGDEMERNYGCRILEYSLYGYKALTIENEYLRVSFLVDKGCDIFELLYKKKDIDFMWRSPEGLRSLKDRIGTKYSASGNFIDYYIGGWQEIFPHGSTAGFYKGAELGFHGEAALIPWEYRIIEDSVDWVKICCTTRLRRVPFIMEKTLSLKREESILYIEEKVTNDSGVVLEYMWGHHPAFGGGFLDENCRIILPQCTVRNGKSDPPSMLVSEATGSIDKMPCIKGGLVDLSKIPPYGSKISEMLFIQDLKFGWFILKNEKLHSAVEFSWDIDVMPYLWLWMEFNGTEEYPWYGKAYTLAVEPFTSPAPTLAQTIEKGYSVSLNPGESNYFWINAKVFDC
jgi:hypothetical protein